MALVIGLKLYIGSDKHPLLSILVALLGIKGVLMAATLTLRWSSGMVTPPHVVMFSQVYLHLLSSLPLTG